MAARAIEVSAISPYVSNWRLDRARVRVKSMLRSVSATDPLKKAFSIELFDSTGDVKFTFWGAAAQEVFQEIEPDEYYSFPGGRVVQAKVAFNGTGHAYEVHYNDRVMITKMPPPALPFALA